MPANATPRPKPSRRPRQRYVLFRLLDAPGPERARLIEALQRAGASMGLQDLWLTRYDGTHGILRCLRGQEEAARRCLQETLPIEGIRAAALSTSGTIAALERRHRDAGLHRDRRSRR